MKRWLMVAAAVACSAGAAWAADPAGQYHISGSSPGGSNYNGTVTVESNGQTYNVHWVVGSSTYEGTGIASGNSFAVYYKSAGDAGVVLYQANGNGWNGLWAHGGGNSVGTEVWKRQ
jgi:hypothetical protein